MTKQEFPMTGLELASDCAMTIQIARANPANINWSSSGAALGALIRNRIVYCIVPMRSDDSRERLSEKECYFPNNLHCGIKGYISEHNHGKTHVNRTNPVDEFLNKMNPLFDMAR